MCVVVERKFKTKFTIRKRRKKRRKRRHKIKSAGSNSSNQLSTAGRILNWNISTKKLGDSKISTFGALQTQQQGHRGQAARIAGASGFESAAHIDKPFSHGLVLRIGPEYLLA